LLLYRVSLSNEHFFLVVPVPENKLSSECFLERPKSESFAFGEIREIYMIKNADGSSKCAAFLRYVKREAAVEAIESLNNNLLMEGCARPLIVKFADNKHQRQQRQIRNVRRQEVMVNMGGPAYPSFSSSTCCLCSSRASSDGHAWASSRRRTTIPVTTSPIRSRHLWAWCAANSTGHLWPGPGATSCNNHPYMYPPHAYAAPPQYAFTPPARQEARQPRIRVPVKVLLVQISLFTICPTT
jgi:hypothetical protein